MVSRLPKQYRAYVVCRRGLASKLGLGTGSERAGRLEVHDPLRVGSRAFLERLYRLEEVVYGALRLSMPRWAYYDCVEIPGIVVGLMAQARALPPGVQRALSGDAERTPELPIAMVLAAPTVEPGHWLTHSVGSITEVEPLGKLIGEGPDPRLVAMTLALRILRAHRVTSTTQWASDKLDIHARFAPLSLLGAWVPWHDKPATCTFRYDVNEARIERVLSVPGPPRNVTEWIDREDEEALRALGQRIERGESLSIGAPPEGRRVPLMRGEAP